jgi:RNA polymerase sigma-70 factor (ECF subfamily)
VLSTELLLRRGAVMSRERVSNDHAFIEALFAQHNGEIYGFLARMLRDDEMAADLTQETFVKAYRALDSLEDRGRARAWLFQIASHAALDELRRRRVVRFVPWNGESRGTAPSAEDAALHGTVSGEMARALARIPDRQRSALLLAELHEMTGVELATALGVTHVAARALLTRARESLRQTLAAERAAARERERDARRGRLPDEPAVANPADKRR